jgi:hypothetical protein
LWRFRQLPGFAGPDSRGRLSPHGSLQNLRRMVHFTFRTMRGRLPQKTEPLARGGVRASGKAMGEGSYYARTENLERRKHGKIVTKNEQKLLRKTNKVVTKSEQGAGGSQAILPRLSFQGYLLSRTH